MTDGKKRRNTMHLRQKFVASLRLLLALIVLGLAPIIGGLIVGTITAAYISVGVFKLIVGFWRLLSDEKVRSESQDQSSTEPTKV